MGARSRNTTKALIWAMALVLGMLLAIPFTYWGVSGTLEVILSLDPLLLVLYASGVFLVVIVAWRIVSTIASL